MVTSVQSRSGDCSKTSYMFSVAPVPGGDLGRTGDSGWKADRRFSMNVVLPRPDSPTCRQQSDHIIRLHWHTDRACQDTVLINDEP